MPPKTNKIQNEIISLIRRFKFEELKSLITPIFPEISWNSIKSKLVKQHQNFTSTNVAKLISLIITKAKLQERVLNDRLLTLRLIDISWHSNRKMWYGYILIDFNESENYFINREIQNNIQNYFNSINMKINVKINTHDGITYISLTNEEIKKAKERKAQRKFSIFFAIFIGQKYFFSTQKQISSDILNAIARSLGSKHSKRFKLMGKNLKSLSELCWKKEESALNTESINKNLVYKDAPPVRKEMGIDFTQQQQRAKYAKECYGDNPPTLELLVINGPHIPFLHKDVLTELSNENIQATWEFRSRNIAVCLSKLIEYRVLITPVPHYISNLMLLGRNEFSLRTDDTNNIQG